MKKSSVIIQHNTRGIESHKGTDNKEHGVGHHSDLLG